MLGVSLRLDLFQGSRRNSYCSVIVTLNFLTFLVIADSAIHISILYTIYYICKELYPFRFAMRVLI